MTRWLQFIVLGLLVVFLYADTASSTPGDPCVKCDCSDRIWVSDGIDPIVKGPNLKMWKRMIGDGIWVEASQAYNNLWTHTNMNCASGVSKDNSTKIRRWYGDTGKLACDNTTKGAYPYEAYTGSVADDDWADQYKCKE